MKLEKYLIKIANGDTSALDKLYSLTSKALFSLAFSILHEKSLAEDAVQDTYLIVLKSKSYKEGGNAFSWLYTICKNCALKILSKQRNSVELDEHREGRRDGTEDKVFIEQLLANLTEREREIVLMHCYGGLKHKEIAEMLEMPEGTVRYVYSESIKKLKEVAK